MIYEKAKQTIKKYGLIKKGDTVIAGVSGGPDSLALLHVLVRLRECHDFQLCVAHLDHSFRGREAEEESLWVMETAKSWGIPATTRKVDVPGMVREKGMSPQEAGHLARAAFFSDLLLELPAQKVALGHHADDQAETLLIHFLTGTGLEGLRGIMPQNGQYIRPLLFCRRKEIEDYCLRNGLDPRQDPSNLKNKYLRNRIRNQLIPWLEENINPNLVVTLNRTAQIVWSEDEFMQQKVKEIELAVVEKIEEKVTLSLIDWDKYPLALQRRLLRLCYSKLVQQGLTYHHVEELRCFTVKGQVGKTLQLPEKIVAEKTYQKILLYPQNVKVIMKGIEAQELKIPGITFIPETGQKIIVEVIDHLGTEDIDQQNFQQVRLPWGDKKEPLIARSRRSGDRITLKGHNVSKKIKKLFIDKKIPCNERERILLIGSGQQIVWIPSLGVCGSIKSHKKVEKYLNLKIENTSVP